MHGTTGMVVRVYTGVETRALDRRAIDEFGIPGIRLMHRAGRAAFAAIRQRWPNATSVSVVCGSGNNAGDGYVIAGCAHDAGLRVQLIEAADPGRLKGDAATARQYARSCLGGIAPTAADWRLAGDVVVDALLGTGVRGAVRAAYRSAIGRINDAGRPVLAVDVPSGVDADRGGLLAPAPVRADVTITFVGGKLGLVTGPGVDFAGEVVVEDLGLPEAVYDQPGVAVLAGHGLAALGRRRDAHKGDFGRLLIVGGECDMGGAVLLAGEAALRAGAGLVSIATRGANRSAILARRPELMVRATRTAADIADLASRATAIAVGPGLGRGEWGQCLLRACIAAGKPLVVDADGLNIVAEAGLSLPTGSIATPHPGEAGRLLDKPTAWIQSHRPQAAAMLSRGDRVAVLKGAGTLVADDGALHSVCVDGNPGMATAGSGDVLTGIVGALLARGHEPRAAAELAVWLHARAGDEAHATCSASLLAGDIVAALRLSP